MSEDRRVSAGSRLPRLLAAGLLVLLAWVMAGLFWTITVPEGASLPHASPPATPADPAAETGRAEDRNDDSSQQSGFARSARFAPFGTAETTTARQIEQAPETGLQLDLKGVLATANGGGVAFISAGSGRTTLYRPGDTIENQPATLDEVHADRVILLRDGQPEILRLPKSDEPVARRGASSDTRDDAAPPPTSPPPQPRAGSAGNAGSMTRSGSWNPFGPSR